MKSTFFERFAAYFIDIIIISLIISIVGYTLPNNTDKYQKQLTEITNKYQDNEVSAEEYANEYMEILYNNQKSNIIESSISVILTIAYFVVFQYMNKGQTLGKKLLKIRVVDKDTNKPTTIVKGLIRSLFTLNIASGVLNILFIYTLNKTSYFLGYGFVGGLEWLFIIITIFFVLYRKDGRGLHDMMTNTTVIKEGRWYNAWIYWSRIN